MLSKVALRRASNFTNKLNETLTNGLKPSVIILNAVSTRNFSIAEIGKRHPKPFDYSKRSYGLFDQFTDSTLRRLGENSLIITVEGNFGAGKTEFAKQLAKNIDFVYAREPDVDYHIFTGADGENRRELINRIVGANQKYHLDNLESWHKKPSFKGTIQLQHQIYDIRFMQTRQALLHLFSTGNNKTK